jgi:ABC-type transporter Mla maintaining outer membrane lipid asymmetry permease subunit MlaE
MQMQTEKKKTVREQMIAVGLQTVVVVVVLLLFVGVVSGSDT